LHRTLIVTNLFYRWLLLAIYVSTGSLLVFAHGLFGVGPAFTGLFLVVTTLGLLLTGQWSAYRPGVCDALFAVFATCVGASLLKNGVGDCRELSLLVLALAAYQAGRIFDGRQISPAFVITTGLVVIAGAITTAAALYEQWDNPHGKALVFGQFDAAPAQFTISLSLLTIALLCTPMSWQRAGSAAVILLVSSAIFAAALVRFAFVALAIALTVTAIASAQPRDRRLALLGICLLITGVGLGNIARSGTAIQFARYAVAAAAIAPDVQVSSSATAAPGVTAAPVATPPQVVQAAPFPPACPTLDMNNSIAIRGQLYSEAVGLLPVAGLFGIGLDRFMERSCIKNAEIHNSVLQAIVEFGWIGGASLVLLLCCAIGSLTRVARVRAEARFALAGLVFLSVMAMAHGRISRDALLFVLLGYAVSISSRVNQWSYSAPSS
jgi:hypothetical protein